MLNTPCDSLRSAILQYSGDISRIELFARPPKDLLFEDESYKGWDLWGNEVWTNYLTNQNKKKINRGGKIWIR